MQVVVLHFSKGGNTKKLAQQIAQGVEQVDGVSCAGAPDERTEKIAIKLGQRVAELAKRLHGEFFSVRSEK